MGCVCTKKSIRIEGVNYAIVEHIGDGWVFTILWIIGVGSNQNKGGLTANTKSVTNNYVIFYTLGPVAHPVPTSASNIYYKLKKISNELFIEFW